LIDCAYWLNGVLVVGLTRRYVATELKPSFKRTS